MFRLVLKKFRFSSRLPKVLSRSVFLGVLAVRSFWVSFNEWLESLCDPLRLTSFAQGLLARVEDFGPE